MQRQKERAKARGTKVKGERRGVQKIYILVSKKPKDFYDDYRKPYITPCILILIINPEEG